MHDLHHDGKLFGSRRDFDLTRGVSTDILERWGARGFRAGFMLHQLDWLHALNIDYDCSTFDVDPFEPQMDGTETIFPFWVPRPDPEADRHVSPEDPGGGDRAGAASEGSPGDPGEAGYVELPYTLVQDLNLFVVLGEKTTEIWERKLEWIAARGGMALLNTHPDCMVFDRGAGLEANEYPVGLYEGFLRQVKQRYGESACYALPGRIAAHVRTFKPATCGSGARSDGGVQHLRQRQPGSSVRRKLGPTRGRRAGAGPGGAQSGSGPRRVERRPGLGTLFLTATGRTGAGGRISGTTGGSDGSVSGPCNRGTSRRAAISCTCTTCRRRWCSRWRC